MGGWKRLPETCKSRQISTNLSVVLLLPTNEVCEGYVFTGVCHSVHGGACVVALAGVCGCSWGACVVALGGHAWLLGGGACVVAWGHVWLLLGGMHGCSRGHVWLLWGGMHGCSGGHAWLLPGGGGGMHGFFDEIRSMSGQYASYWNAFLFWRVIYPSFCHPRP